jgi:hypothetical protein
MERELDCVTGREVSALMMIEGAALDARGREWVLFLLPIFSK